MKGGSTFQFRNPRTQNRIWDPHQQNREWFHFDGFWSEVQLQDDDVNVIQKVGFAAVVQCL